MRWARSIFTLISYECEKLLEGPQENEPFLTALKEQQDNRALVDYYMADVADVAVYVINCWLMLQDARGMERKREMARVYIAETMAKIRGRVAMLQAIDPAPLQAREIILAESF